MDKLSACVLWEWAYIYNIGCSKCSYLHKQKSNDGRPTPIIKEECVEWVVFKTNCLCEIELSLTSVVYYECLKAGKHWSKPEQSCSSAFFDLVLQPNNLLIAILQTTNEGIHTFQVLHNLLWTVQQFCIEDFVTSWPWPALSHSHHCNGDSEPRWFENEAEQFQNWYPVWEFPLWASQICNHANCYFDWNTSNCSSVCWNIQITAVHPQQKTGKVLKFHMPSANHQLKAVLNEKIKKKKIAIWDLSKTKIE